MRRTRQIVRVVRTGVLGFAIFMLALYAASFAEIWWNRAPSIVAGLSGGAIVINYSGARANVDAGPPGWSIGEPLHVSVEFNSSAATMQDRNRWVYSIFTVRNSPSRRPGEFSHNIRVFPARLAGIAGSVALVLLLVPARKARPGYCGNCGYSRKGLSAETVCPECGMESPRSPVSTATCPPPEPIP